MYLRSRGQVKVLNISSEKVLSTYCFLLKQSTYYQNNLQTEQKQTPGKDATSVLFVKNKSKTHAFVLAGLFQE